MTAWLGNELQDEAFDKLYTLEHKVKEINDPQMIIDWEYLQTSDHFYYMCTKWFSDGDVHKYFNPYGTPYEAFINYMNVFSDFEIRVNEGYENLKNERKKEHIKEARQHAVAESTSQNQIKRFSHLISVSDGKLRTALKNFESKIIFNAITKAKEELKDKILSNVNKKMLSEIESYFEEGISPTEHQVKYARKQILKGI